MTTLKTLPLLAATIAITGCCTDHYMNAQHPSPIGTASDPFWQAQEGNAEAFDFVVHEHEFIGNSARLNPKGEDHVKQIAARILTTTDQEPFPVAVEPSSMSRRPGDKYGFPVHNDPKLDAQRRDVVVAALEKFGVGDAKDIVVVSPDYGPGYEANEAERSYNQFINPGRGGFGNGFGGGGLGGGFGGGFGGGGF